MFDGPRPARRSVVVALLALSLVAGPGARAGRAAAPGEGSQAAPPSPTAAEAADLAAARAVFNRHIEAIQHRDAKAYLACDLDSPGLVRTGPEGFELGIAGLAAGVGNAWPDHLEAEELRLTPVRPGVVYGTYRYRVRYGPDEQSGISERLFVATPAGWRIAITTAFASPESVPGRPLALVGATLLDGTGAAPVRD